jgi:hypothetical protein
VKHKPYIRAGCALRSIAAQKEALHFPAQLRHGRIEGFAAGIDDDGTLRTQPIQLQSDGLADATPDAIPYHGFADGAGNGKTDTRAIRRRLPDHESREQRARILRPVVVYPSEVFGPQQTNTFRKTSDGGLPLGADRQLVTAAGAAAGENGASVLSLHPGAEAVRLGAMAIIRLKSAFRHDDSRI